MRRSTKKEIKGARGLVLSTQARIKELLQSGKKVHIIWDFDGVLVNSRSDDVFALTGSNLAALFAYEERLLLQSPDQGLWLLPIAHNTGIRPHFPQERFTQDIVTSRSGHLTIRVHIFCVWWSVSTRWVLTVGHQSKQGSYRIILESLKDDPDYYIFCIDDSAKHIEEFEKVSRALGMNDRTFGIVSPVIRTYSKKELQEHLRRVMNAVGNVPLRVRDPSNDACGFIVLPGGLEQFKVKMGALVGEISNAGHHQELRNKFVATYGEVGAKQHFKTEDDLNRAMTEFLVGLWCP